MIIAQLRFMIFEMMPFIHIIITIAHLEEIKYTDIKKKKFVEHSQIKLRMEVESNIMNPIFME